jgi:hypothetical protein
VSIVQGPTHLRPGYELGVTNNQKDYYICNHLVLNVLVHKSHGEYTRAQNSAITSSIAVDTSGRRMLSWSSHWHALARPLCHPQMVVTGASMDRISAFAGPISAVAGHDRVLLLLSPASRERHYIQLLPFTLSKEMLTNDRCAICTLPAPAKDVAECKRSIKEALC